MAIANAIDPAQAAGQLTEWLRAQLPGATGMEVVDMVAPSSSGLSTETLVFTLRYELEGSCVEKRQVVRVQPSGPAVFPRYDLAHEARVMNALAEQTGIPVPAISGTESDPSVLGAPFFVMDHVEGEAAADDPPFTVTGWLTELAPDGRAEVYDNALVALSEIHKVDWRALDLGFLDRPEDGHDPVDQLITHYERSFEWAGGDVVPTVTATLAWLRDHKPAVAGPAVLLHGDARLANFLIRADRSVSAVLDWELARLGTSEIDLGWWLFVMRHYTDGIGVPLPEGYPDAAATIARFEELIGRELRDMHYYEVLGGAFLGVVMVRVAGLMTAAGAIPAESTMAANNPATQLLAAMLDLAAPEGTADTFIGNR